MVECLTKGIKVKPPCIQARMAVIMQAMRKDFSTACNYLSTIVTQRYASQQLEVQQQKAKKHDILLVYGRHGGNHKQGCSKTI
jgi:hypothetical protein